ncbi:MAG: extracellular solute-binding protein family 1 [Paenibacillus sp.]|nr:extracellular solute-binding protein family 1 [Paenibacillus sp.]
MHKRLLAAAALVVLAGCSAGEKNATRETSKTPAQDTVTITKDPVELTIFYLSSDSSAEAFMSNYGDHIVKKYPNFKLNWINTKNVTLADLAASGTKVDLFYAGGAATLWDSGFVADISEQAKKFKMDLTKFDQSSLDGIRKASNGKLTGLPIYIQYHILYYNRAIFDRFGVPYLKDGMTWDDLLPIARRLTRLDGGVQYSGFGHRFFSANWPINQYGQELIDPSTGKVTFDTSPKWKTMFETFLPFFQIQGNPYQTGAVWADQFAKDKTLAISAQLSGYASSTTQFPEVDWDMASLPTFADAPGVGTGPQPFQFYPSTNSVHKDEAFAALSVLASEDYQAWQARFAKYPAMKLDNMATIFASEQPLLKGKNVNALLPKKFAPALTLSQDASAINGAISQSFDAAMKGQKDMNSALREATEQANKILAERKQANGK